MDIGFIYAISAAVLWGFVYALDEKILSSLTPIAFLFLTSVVTSLVLLPFVFFVNDSIKDALHAGKINTTLILLSSVLGAVANFCIFAAIKHLDASTASIIEIAYPFFVILFSALIFRSAPNMYFFLGGILVFIGSTIIIRFA